MSLDLTLEDINLEERRVLPNGFEKCIWKKMANDPKSTTFEPVRGRLDHPLSKCLYSCDGLSDSCQNYRSEKSFGYCYFF